MNSIHDMGGMDGMGPIEAEPNEPVFHEPWEGRVLALTFRIGPWSRGRNWGSGRFGLESIPAADYLRMSYYERWFTRLVDRLLRSNLVTPAELESGEADPELSRPTLLPASTGASPGSARLDVEVSSRFRRSSPCARATCIPGVTYGCHATRAASAAPWSVDHGVFALQDTDVNGQRLGARPQHVYTVRFTARELWGDRASARDTVYVDLWEDYLEPT